MLFSPCRPIEFIPVSMLMMLAREIDEMKIKVQISLSIRNVAFILLILV